MEPNLVEVEVGNGWYYFRINNSEGKLVMQEYYHDTPEEKEIGRLAILKRWDERLKEEAREKERVAKEALLATATEFEKLNTIEGTGKIKSA